MPTWAAVTILLAVIGAFQVWQQRRLLTFETFQSSTECLNLANLSQEYMAGLSSFAASMHHDLDAEDAESKRVRDPLFNIDTTRPSLFFFTPQQTYAYLLADPDRYVDNMENDRIFRHLGYTTKKEYIEHASTYAVGYTAKEKARIYEMCAIVEIYMNAYFNTTPAQQASIPWVFALTQGRAFENGEPHVRALPRGGIIFLGTRWMYEIIDDTCAFGWMLLYWRLAIFASQCLLPQHVVKHVWENVPWTPNVRSWESADTHPTCLFFQRAQKMMEEGRNTLTS